MIKLQPVVSVCMITYNHENYIREAIEGVLKQKTDFPIELIIGEDCSTDGTRKIVVEYAKKYPNIILSLLSETNLGMMRNFLDTMKAAKGKYIALCEGDDFWIDPYKLQKQVDFLEENQDFGLCYTRCKYYIQEKKINVVSPFGKAEKFDELLLENTIPTLTVLMRSELVNVYMSEIQPEKHVWKMGDYPMWLWFSAISKIKFIDFETGTYRELSKSACHDQDIIKSTLFRLNVAEIQIFFSKRYNKGSIIEKNLSTFYFEILHSLYANYHKGHLFSVDLAKFKIKLYDYSSSNMTFLNRLRLWGLGNKTKYEISKSLIRTYHKFRII